MQALPAGEIEPIVRHRLLADSDTTKRGWVLEGFPQSKEQALMLQTLGVVAKHVCKPRRHLMTSP